ncbi:two-component system sensor histidine kinase YesM [Scopulibacillus darangshiensis]|uniref:Two-component system sensor histidine kinase YesM n=1 Tax=Scopulibacillus darangshiensis TaxID=442528 RepID=A0A4R2P6E8_9BACL|nr:sensor histidine kinase [Scopulibacillus darangshiensis]TCP29561.1 two-component system sensor histidine kinase YesM [Scopulibacillus darangshiensis]
MMQTKWPTISLRTKLLTMFIILTAVPLIIVGIISYMKSYQTVWDHSIASSSLIAESVSRKIDTFVQDIEKQYVELADNQSVLHFLTTDGDTYEEAKDILNTFNLLRETYKFTNKIIDVKIINRYGRGISERKGVYKRSTDEMKNKKFLNILNNPNEPLIISSDHTSEAKHPTVSIMMAVKHTITNEVIGFMTIDIDAALFKTFCSDAKLGNTGHFYIVERKGNPIFMPTKVKNATHYHLKNMQTVLTNKKGNFIEHSNQGRQFVVYSTSRLTGWKVIGEAPLNQVMKAAYDIRHFIFISVFLSTLFAIILYFFISSRLTRPILDLKGKMEQAAAGHLDTKVINHSQDEIADLGNSFNIMLKKIRALINNSIKEQKQIKKAEIRAMQAQINPHFLYNTLDSIVWMAEAKKSREVIELVKSLSHFFRITLSKGRDQILLKDEIEHVRNYLTILKMRYNDIFDFQIDIDPKIYDCNILKLTLQPVVENALYHGIKNKRGIGSIRITGKDILKDQIRIEIIDNGIGMTEEKLADIRSQLSSDDRDHLNDRGFGLNNVHKRLQFYYGKPFGVTIESTYLQGTTVLITIPAKRS